MQFLIVFSIFAITIIGLFVIARRGTKVDSGFFVAMFLAVIVFSMLSWVVLPLLTFNPDLMSNLTGLSSRKGNTDAISFALQVGRLDVISFVLGLVAVGLGFFALFTFVTLKEDAKRIAEDTVTRLIDNEIERSWARRKKEIEGLVEISLLNEAKSTRTSEDRSADTEATTKIDNINELTDG